LFWLPVIFAGCTQVDKSRLPSQQSAVEVAEISESVVDAQERWLLGFKTGQSIEHVNIPVGPSGSNNPSKSVSNEFYYSVESTHQGKLYQYIQGKYPGTNVLYGLYFEDQELIALLIDQEVVDFYHCEYPFRHGYKMAYKPWPAYHYQMEAINNWVKKRNRLGTDFNARAVHKLMRPVESKKEMSVADAVVIVTYLPLIAIGTQAYAVSFLPPVNWLLKKEEGKRQKKRQQWAEAANQIHPGSVTEDDLLRLMGVPASKFAWQGGSGWQYSWPGDPYGLNFGIKNGLVIWKQSGFRKNPENESTSWSGNCGEMHVER
jgi:hypothetical protein